MRFQAADARRGWQGREQVRGDDSTATMREELRGTGSGTPPAAGNARLSACWLRVTPTGTPEISSLRKRAARLKDRTARDGGARAA